MRVREAVELFLEVQGSMSVESLDFIDGPEDFRGVNASAADYLPRSYGGVEEGNLPTLSF